MATIIIPNFLTQKTMVGLNTYTYTIVNAGMHIAHIVVSHHAPSNLTCAITQAGSVNTTLTTATVQPVTNPNNTAQSSLILQATANCQPGDVISFVLTSSSANDKQLNTVKSDMIVRQGMGN